MSPAPRVQTSDIAKLAQRPGDATAENEPDRAAALEGREPGIENDASVARDAGVVGNDATGARDGAVAGGALVARDASVTQEDSARSREEERLEAARTPEHTAGTREAELDAEDVSTAPLFGQGVEETFRKRWDAIQAAFVDDPRHAVEQADALVSEIIRQLTDTFAQERSKLEQQFNRKHEEAGKSEISTENLRHTLRHYRSFFTRLLSV